MNERIRQLWDRAQEEIKAEYEDESRRNRRLYNEIFLPKFAQLIIKECIELADDEASRFYNMDEYELASVMENFREKLKEHFGIEE